jgi:hypothetical protein
MFNKFYYLDVAVNVTQHIMVPPCPPIPHFSSKLHCTWKFPTQISKTGPQHTFCIHLLWGLRVFTSTDIVQPSPQLNHVSGSITLSNFHSSQSNPTPLHTWIFTQCFNTWLQFLYYRENCSVVWLRDHLLWLAWSYKCQAVAHKLQLPQKCHNILCPLFQECCVSCILLCPEFCCHGIAAPCVVGIVTVWRNQQIPVGKAFNASVLHGFFWSHCYSQSLILCVFSYTDIILDENSASSLKIRWSATFLLLLKGRQHAI